MTPFAEDPNFAAENRDPAFGRGPAAVSSADSEPAANSGTALSVPLAPVETPRDPAWTALDVIRIVLMTILAFVLVFIGLTVLVPGHTFRARLNGLSVHLGLQIIGQMFVYVVIFGYMYVLVTRERHQPKFWQAMHWNWPTAVWIFPAIGIFLQVVFLIFERFLTFPKEVPFDAIFRQPLTILLVSVFSITLGPLMEEMFFRGFFYPVVRRHMGVATAILATALPFALMHAAQYGYSWASILLIFIVGVVLAAVREYRDSLAASFLVHVGYNGTIILLLFVGTDGFRHLEKLQQ